MCVYMWMCAYVCLYVCAFCVCCTSILCLKKSLVVGLEVIRELIDEGEGHAVGFVDLRTDSIAAAAAADAVGRSNDIHDVKPTFQFFASRYIRRYEAIQIIRHTFLDFSVRAPPPPDPSLPPPYVKCYTQKLRLLR
jgi:hypothetical protein